MNQPAPEIITLQRSASGTVASPPVFAASGPTDVAEPSTVGEGSGTGVGVGAGVAVGFGDGSGTNAARGDGNGTPVEFPDTLPDPWEPCAEAGSFEPEPCVVFSQ